MSGFGMRKKTGQETSSGGFGMTKSNEKDSIDSADNFSLPSYLEMRNEGEEFDLFYTAEGELESVAEIYLEDDVEINLTGSGFTSADYDNFLERAGLALEEEGELENPYTLLEQVDDYA